MYLDAHTPSLGCGKSQKFVNFRIFSPPPYMESPQTESIYPKRMKPYDKKLFKKAQTMYDISMASWERYEHYHKYFEKVTARIRKYDFEDELINKSVRDYLDGCKKRKAQMLKLLFPYMDKEGEYGTIIGLRYPSAMLEIDRQELSTYQMILNNMYSSISIEEINAIFKE